MQRLWEILLGVERGFLGREGELSLQFNPRWPFQEVVGAATWNLILCGLAAFLVVRIYRREGRSRWARIGLGLLRGALLAFVIAMLNRPVLTLGQSRTEPSVLAIMLDRSISMQVRDVGQRADGSVPSRFEAMMELLGGPDKSLLAELAANHEVRIYEFDRDARPVLTLPHSPPTSGGPPSEQPQTLAALDGLEPSGQSTQILRSLHTVLEEVQGQRLAGVVLLTDGRSTPLESVAEMLPRVRQFEARIYPVSIGGDDPPRNLAVESIDVEEAVFVRDLVNARVNVRASGFPTAHEITVVLKDKATGRPLSRSDGSPAQRSITVEGDGTYEVEINFKPAEVGSLGVVAEVARQSGEVDDEDNSLTTVISVLDAQIAVLYCEGYPRWEYRYLKNQMIRDPTVEISCLLFSAEAGFAQEGDRPITRFPESMSEMLYYDVVLLGDVDPRQFSDAQLHLISEFVSAKNGGFGMIAGPIWSPYAFRNSPIEPVLPVTISREPPPEPPSLTVGWRPVLTRDGEASTIFRFFESREENERFLRDEIQPLFWYSRGISAKPGVGEVYAEHPTDLGPDGRKAPLLVLGRFGGGRTLFSAIDDTWRWRFYTGESVFDTYWVQQLRYLARSRKLQQRRFSLTALRPAYELGEQVQVTLRILDGELLRQLPDQIAAALIQQSDTGEQAVRQEILQRDQTQLDLYRVSWTADQVGRFVLRLPALAGNVAPGEVPLTIKVPRLELLTPAVDRALLSHLAAGRAPADAATAERGALSLSDIQQVQTVRRELARIPSAARVIPVYTNELLWNAPLAMGIFVLLVTAEWVLRKMYGML